MKSLSSTTLAILLVLGGMAGLQGQTTVEPTSQSVGNSAGSTDFTITSTVNWTVDDDADWLTLSTAGGSGTAVLTASFTANSVTSPRTATITITADDVTIPVTVVQAAADFILTVDPASQAAGNAAGSTTFNITSNTSWTADDNADWLTLSTASGSGDATLTADYTANSVTTSRTATITVIGGGFTRTVTVVQAAADFILTVDPASQPVSNAAGSTTFNIASNTSWTTSDDADWLTLSTASGSGDATLTANYTANSVTTSRTATITVIGGGFTRTVTVVQAAADFILTVDPASQAAGNAAGSTTFNIASNTSWTADDDADWLTLSAASGSGDATLTADYTVNSITTSRTATITLIGGGFTRTVTVVQAAADFILTVDPASQAAGNAAGSTTFNITSNTTWTASDDAEWLTLSTASGSGDATLTATFDANSVTAQRTATITVIGGGFTRTVTVVQAAADFILTVDPASQAAGNAAGSTTFNIASNTSWTADDNADWLTLSTASGLGDATLTANYTANPVTATRTATITVIGGGFTRTVTVVQAAAYYLTVDPASQPVGNAAGSTTFNITSNTTWTADDNADWLTLSTASGSGDATLTANYTANSVTTSRTATITVIGGGFTRTVTVIQAAAFFLTIDPASQPVGNSAGSTTFNIASNTTWTTSDDADWLTLNAANGSGNTTLTASYTANPVTTTRTATITLIGGGFTRTVTVVQAAAFYLTIDPASQPVGNAAGSTTFNIASNTSWTTSDDADWLTLSAANGSGNTTLTASYTANPVTTTRTATITLIGGGFTRTVTVVQAAGFFLTVDPASQPVGNAAGSTNFSIASNTSWTTSDDADWLTLSAASGSGNTTLTATFDANSVTALRTATITVIGGGFTRTVTVVQAAAYYLTVDPASQAVHNSAGSTTFNIASNTIWTTSDDADWLTLSAANGSGNTTLTASFDANSVTALRTATITLIGGGFTRTVTVVQAAAYYLTIDPASQSVGNTAGSTNFSIASNTSWTTSDDVDWLTLSAANGSGNTTLTASYTANPVTTTRTATITLIGGGFTRTVTVVQAAAYYLTVDPASQPVGNTAGSTNFAIASNTTWTTSDDADWLTLSAANGSGNTTLTASYTANPVTTTRTATITLIGGGFTRTVTVVQAAAYYLTIDPASQSVGNTAGSTSFSITSNTTWTTSDDADWLTLSSAGGSGDATLTATFTASNVTTIRTATITLIGGGITRTVTVIQAAAYYLTVDPASQPVGNSAGSTTFNIASNTIWTASDNADWLTLSSAGGTNNATITASYTVNPVTTTRTATITVIGGGFTRTVTVVQAAAYFLSISTERLDFASDAGHSSFTISSNAPWSTTIDAAWLSVTPATGSNSATLTVSVLANTTTNPRRGEITVSGGGITRTLLVSQHAAEAILTVSQPSLTFAAGAGNAIVNLISNVTWAISDDAEWITLSAASGSNNATIAISVTANPLSSVRSGILTITGGGLTRTISVSQAASALSLTVSPPSLTFGAGAGSTTFTLSANVPWSASDDAVWITLSPASGTKDTTVAVTVTANPSTSSRGGTVTLTGGGITRTVAISQSGESAVLTTSLTTLPFSAGAGSATFSVTSNVSWSVSEDAAWISISPVSATYNATVTLTVLANPSTASRSATVNVSGGGVARTITVNQSGAAAVLTVAPVSLSFGAGAGSSTFGITSNLSWSVSDDAPWLSASPASGARDTTVTVTVAANTTTIPRSGTLSVTGGGITRSVTVTQSAAAAILTASTTSLIFSASSGSAGFSVSSNISWSASADAAWLTVSPASGTGDTMMTVAVTANPTVNPRSALVVITGGGITRNVAVTQSAGAAAITLSRSAIPFGADAATAELEVTANISWSASDDAAWLMVSPAAAPNDTTVTVTALANPATSARTATVTFTGGGVVRTLTVTQAGSAANLSVNPAGLSFAAGAASAPLAVTANVAWSADDNAPWVTLSPAGGSRDTTVTVMVTANPTTSSRSATVTITGGGMSRSVAINQSAAAALLTVAETSLVFAADSTRSAVVVRANISWSVSTEAAWLSATPVSGMNDATVTIVAAANPSTSQRSAVVSITGGGITRTITVTQSGAAAALSVAPDSLKFGHGEANGFLLVRANISWSLGHTASWIQLLPASGTGDSTVTVTVAANSSTTGRSAAVIFTGGGMTRTVRIEQSGAPDAGTILVRTNVDQAAYTITGPAQFSGNGREFTIQSAPSGLYTITFGQVMNYIAPPEGQLRLTAGDTIRFTAEYILITADFWQKADSLSIGPISPLAVSPDGAIFAGSERSGIFRSTDYGSSWVPVNQGLTDLNISALAVSSAGPIFAGSVMSGTFRSTNQGENWVAIHNEFAALNISALAVNAQDQIFSGTWNGAIFRSTDYGSTWKLMNRGLTASNISALAVSAAGDLFAGSWSNGLFRSRDNGANWSPVNTGFTIASRVRSLVIDHNGTIYAGTLENGLFRSTDNGENWLPLNTGLTTRAIRSLAVNGAGALFAGTDAGVIHSADAGESWTLLNSGLTNPRITALAINAKGYLFAGTESSEFFSSIQPTTEVKYEAPAPPAVFSIRQNYPNPFNPVTTITYSLERPAHTEIHLYNIRGQRVRTLLAGMAGEGVHQVSWDSRDDNGRICPAGVYIALMVSGERRESIKLLLLR